MEAGEAGEEHRGIPCLEEEAAVEAEVGEVVDRNREGAEAEVAQKLPKQVEGAEGAAAEERVLICLQCVPLEVEVEEAVEAVEERE